MRSLIIGTGMAVPDLVVTNDDLSRFMDTDDEWVRSRTGVRERRIAAPGQSTSDLAVESGNAALADAGVDPMEVDALVVATMTPDYYAPGPAPIVQHGMGLRNDIGAFCIRQQCSGFLYALDIGDALIRSGKARTVVVTGAEVHAGVQPWITAFDRWVASGEGPTAAEWDLATRNRAWAVLFGDGAGSVVLRATDDDSVGILGSRLFTDGSLFELIHIPALGSKARPFVDADQIEHEAHIPRMQGPLLYRQAVRQMPDAAEKLLADHGLTIDDIDVIVAHQANERILDGVRKRLDLGADKVPQNLDRYGNTTAGTLPILYHELRSDGRVGADDTVLFVAFGAGAHWGAAIHRGRGR